MLSAVIVVIVIVIAAAFFLERSKVAMIIDDEAAWDFRDASPRKKVIITKDGMIARYVGEDEKSYIGEIQDDFIVPKEDAIVETWYACDGKGVISLSEEGAKPAYAAPDSLSATVGELRFERGYCPETYRCKGYRDGWFAIEMDGNTGYIREDLVCWDIMDTN